jgi:glucose 1-dehydrogenase
MNGFENQTAIISGALGDIGRAIAHELATRGADIALGDVREASDATEVLAALHTAGVRACYHRVDVSDAKQVGDWVTRVEDELSTPSLIIPNAAIVTVKHIAEISMEEWAREISINLNGAFYLAQAAGLRLLQKQQAGRIVFVGSWAAERPHPHIPAYSAAKAGLRMLMQCMALEWAPHNILVNEVAPGYVDAGLSGRIFEENADLKAQAIRQVPIHQLIDTAEVAAHVAYLCDPKNRHMTGATLTFDGGLSLQGTIAP